MNSESPLGFGMAVLLNELHPRDLYSIVSYLDGHTLEGLVRSLPTTCAPNFLHAVRMNHFLRNFILKADRSLYMPFYTQPSYVRVENDLLRTLCGHSGIVLCSFLDSYQGLFWRLKSELQGFDEAEGVIEEVRQTLLDPELPFPKLRKQSVGSHCNSAFQYFLVDKLLSGEEQQEPDQPFASLKQFLQQRHSYSQGPSAEQQPLQASVLCEWLKIGADNYQQHLREGMVMHNVVVLVVALIDLLTDSVRFFLQSIPDPLHCFVEFNVRYCMLRNSILALQEKLGCLFTNCSQMSVWRIALSKWYLQVQRRHEQHFRVFFYLLRKVNLAAIKAEVDARLDQDEAFIQLKNCLALADIDLLQRQECFQVYSLLEEQLEGEPSLYRQLIQEYMEYTIDISVNEYSVHWCGHSQHRLHVPFTHFEALLLPHFRIYLRQLLETAHQVAHSQLAIEHTLSALLVQLDSDFLKPVTLRQLVHIVREETQAVTGDQLRGQAAMKAAEMERYMVQEDKRVELFNQLNCISSDPSPQRSIIIQQEDFARLLKDSASTTASKPTPSFLMEYHQDEHSMDEEHYSFEQEHQ